MSDLNLSLDEIQYVAARSIVMVDWTILSPTFLRAVVEWAVAVVIVLAVGQAARRRTPGTPHGECHSSSIQSVRALAAISESIGIPPHL